MTTIAQECISPELAQRRVNQFLVISLGDRLYSGKPEERNDEQGRFYWAVPVMVHLVEGDNHRAGQILVDATSGRLKLEDTTVEEIRATVKALSMASIR